MNIDLMTEEDINREFSTDGWTSRQDGTFMKVVGVSQSCISLLMASDVAGAYNSLTGTVFFPNCDAIGLRQIETRIEQVRHALVTSLKQKTYIL